LTKGGAHRATRGHPARWPVSTRGRAPAARRQDDGHPLGTGEEGRRLAHAERLLAHPRHGDRAPHEHAGGEDL